MNETLLKERLRIYDDAINCRKPSRVPTMSNAYTWKIFDSDTKAKLSVATSDWALMEKIVREHIERYHFDGHQCYGIRNNSNIGRILGDTQHVINDETGAVYALDRELMKPDEYHEFVEDIAMFHWTKFLPRKFGELTFGQMEDVVKATMDFGAYWQKITKIAVNEYGIPLTNQGYLLHPLEQIFTAYRGIKAFSNDMRRIPEKMVEFTNAAESAFLNDFDATIAMPKDALICNTYTAFLVTSIMSQKQWEKFYYPTFKKMIEKLVKQNRSMYVFVEAEFMRYYEYFQNIPSGHLIVHVEKDDVFEIKKKLPNICVAGGMSVDLLGKATPQRCVDRAKKLVEELGGSGYVFSQDKMMSFPYDATRENMLAVQDFVLNYKL